MTAKTTLKDFFKGGLLSIKNNKSLFLTSFIVIFIISLINTYLEQNITIGEIQGAGDMSNAGYMEIFTIAFKLIPIFIFPSLFVVIASVPSESKLRNIKYILTPLKKFRFYLMLLSIMTVVAAILGIAMISFSSAINKGIELQKYHLETASFIQIHENSDIFKGEVLFPTPIDKANQSKYDKIIEKKTSLEEEARYEFSKITKFDIAFSAFLSVLVLSLYLNYYIISSALISTTNIGVFRTIRISFVSFFKNIKFVAPLIAAWILIGYIIKFTLFSLIGVNEVALVAANLLESITLTTFIFFTAYIIFRKLFLEKSIIDINPFDENVKKKFFNPAPMANEDVTFNRFASCIVESHTHSKGDFNENKEAVTVINKLRK